MDPVNSPPPFNAREYSRTSSASEFDSPSDSDWLDISSNRESDDNDSVSSDSDHDRVDDAIPSRRSSISLGSSRDGDIEAWEGFVDDISDEVSPIDQVTSQASPIASPAALDAVPVVEKDVAEEQRVKDALDQSMISTLSASRSSSLGASGHHSPSHNSPRDLKLSFPDPLTSSRDELTTSYGNVSQSEATFSTTDADDLAERPDTPASHHSDPGLLVTPEVPQVETTSHTPTTCYLDIVLYGSSPSFKWTLIDKLVEKAAIGGGGRAVVISHKITNTYTRLLRIQNQGQHESFSFIVSVTDRTEFHPGLFQDVRLYLLLLMNLTSTCSQSRAKSSSDRPSLAVIYLPSNRSLPLSTDHDYYLPVFVRPFVDVNPPEVVDAASEARRIWDTLAIPTTKILRLVESEKFYIPDNEDLDEVRPSHVQDIFQRIAAPEVKKPLKRSACPLTRVHTMSL